MDMLIYAYLSILIDIQNIYTYIHPRHVKIRMIKITTIKLKLQKYIPIL